MTFSQLKTMATKANELELLAIKAWDWKLISKYNRIWNRLMSSMINNIKDGGVY